VKKETRGAGEAEEERVTNLLLKFGVAQEGRRRDAGRTCALLSRRVADSERAERVT
jgi:hypothetical protein